MNKRISWLKKAPRKLKPWQPTRGGGALDPCLGVGVALRV